MPNHVDLRLDTSFSTAMSGSSKPKRPLLESFRPPLVSVLDKKHGNFQKASTSDIHQVKQLPRFSWMPEIRDAASMARKGRMPFRTDEKSKVLRKLQGEIYFEKRLSATMASCNGNSLLALPSWFVKEHGDKLEKTVILRSESSIQPWDVKLKICRDSRAFTQIKFSGGWKAFAVFHGLLGGDSVIFSLTALSEFKVYIFRGTSRNPKRRRSQDGPRKWSVDGSEPARKKAKQAYYRKDDYYLADDQEGNAGTVTSNGLFAEKKTVGEERAVSASGHGSTSCSLESNSEHLHHLASENVQEPAFNRVERIMSGVTGNVMSERRAASVMAKRGRMPLRGDDKTKLLRRLQGTIHFEKTLSTSSVSHRRKSALIMPSSFVKEHGDKFWKSVVLRSESSTKSWHVMLNIEPRSPTSARVKLSGGWRAFADFNNLLEGDSLVFSLTAMSEFEVYIFPGTGNPKRGSQAPRKWYPGSEPSRKRAKQVYENQDEQLIAEKNIGGAGTMNGATKTKVEEDCAVSRSCRNIASCSRLLEFPLFMKKLTATNICRSAGVMEIPLEFCKRYGNRLHSHVKLQGIHEESEVRSMACLRTHANPRRHYLRAEWRDFADENNLEVGQEILFALTVDSFFVVREVLPPSTGEGYGSRL